MLSKILTFEVGWFDVDQNSSGGFWSKLAKEAIIVSTQSKFHYISLQEICLRFLKPSAYETNLVINRLTLLRSYIYEGKILGRRSCCQVLITNGAAHYSDSADHCSTGSIVD